MATIVNFMLVMAAFGLPVDVLPISCVYLNMLHSKNSRLHYFKMFEDFYFNNLYLCLNIYDERVL